MIRIPGAEVAAAGNESESPTKLMREPEVVDAEMVAFDPDSGDSRYVATSGKANHRSIQAAIDAARSDQAETISIAAGFYRESLTINKPVRLVAADPENKPRVAR